MMAEERRRSWARRLAFGAVLLLLDAAPAAAGTSGRLEGRVVDKQGQALPGANVSLVGVPLGAATDADGRYSILNIPAGTYGVRFGLIGYRPVLVEKLAVSADQNTQLNMTLDESPVQLNEVVVVAKPPVVDVTLTSNVAKVTRTEIAKLPVQELQDIVNLQAGVVDGHIRGGRAGEVQYQVDGTTVNNVYDNQSSLKLDRSLLEEVQVISGTFDAEYGQAMSGVVNAVLRRAATDRTHWSAEIMQGAFAYDASARALPGYHDPVSIANYEFHPFGIQNYQLTVTGPTGVPRTSYLLSARRAYFDDYIYGQRIFNPTDRVDVDAQGYLHPSGDGEVVPLNPSRSWSTVARLTHQARPGLEFDYQAIGELEDSRPMTYVYRVEPDGLPQHHSKSLTQGLTLTHTLSKRTYYKVGVRQNYFHATDWVYENLYDPRYAAAGPPYSSPNDPLARVLQGVDFNRFEQYTNGAIGNGSLVMQRGQHEVYKFGGEMQFPHLEFGNPGYLVYQGSNSTLYHYDQQPPDYPGVQKYQPLLGAFYGQDDVEWSDLRLRAGMRVEYFSARTTVPSDPANPADSISGAPPSHPQATTVKWSVMPRIGVSFPVTSRSAISFAYAHTSQMPPLRDIFTNSNYNVLAELQAATELGKFGVLGNPDVKPERTVQYQFGYKQAITEDLGLDLTLFYKDIRDLLGVEFISTYNDAVYARVTNVDFGNVEGFTLTLDHRALGPLNVSLDYTWQIAQANASDPQETFTRAENNEDPRPRLVPLNWDQRHTLNLSLLLTGKSDYNVGLIFRTASGQPYTPQYTAGFGGSAETNSGRKPAALNNVDLRAEKFVKVGSAAMSMFARVFNVFDSRYFNGYVFASTGSPYYSSPPGQDPVQLADPTRYYGPRRIEIGITMDSTRR
ncbi:MAG: TonB-dependent receptor [Candidatus Eiseniibacteriota bacterium]